MSGPLHSRASPRRSSPQGRFQSIERLKVLSTMKISSPKPPNPIKLWLPIKLHHTPDISKQPIFLKGEPLTCIRRSGVLFLRCPSRFNQATLIIKTEAPEKKQLDDGIGNTVVSTIEAAKRVCSSRNLESTRQRNWRCDCRGTPSCTLSMRRAADWKRPNWSWLSMR